MHPPDPLGISISNTGVSGRMAWLPVILAALALWLGYILYRARALVKEGRRPARGLVFVLMGNQAGSAEWFLRNLYRAEGLLTGRVAAAVAVEGTSDDTAGIVEIMSREKGFRIVQPGDWAALGRGGPPGIWYFDVRGFGIRQLKAVLRSLRAL